MLTNAFYWDRDDETRAWSKRFFERMKRMPHMGDAGDYSSTMHYLKAAQAAGTDDAQSVMAKMREISVNDFFAKDGRIREDGRMLHDMYVYEVKKPSESKGDWDYYKLSPSWPWACQHQPGVSTMSPVSIGVFSPFTTEKEPSPSIMTRSACDECRCAGANSPGRII